MLHESANNEEAIKVPINRFYFDRGRSFARIEQIADAINSTIQQVRGKISSLWGAVLSIEAENESGHEVILYCIEEIRDLLSDQIKIDRRISEDGFVKEGERCFASAWSFWQVTAKETKNEVSVSVFGKTLTGRGIPFKYAVDRRNRNNTKVYAVDEMAEVLESLLEKRKLQRKIRAAKGLHEDPGLGPCGSRDTLAQHFEVSERAFDPRVNWDEIPHVPGITAHGRSEILYQAAAVKGCLKDVLEAEYSIKNGECGNYITVARLVEKYDLRMRRQGVQVRLKKHLPFVVGMDRKSGEKLKLFNEKAALEVLKKRVSPKVSRIEGHEEFMDPRLGRCLLVNRFLSEMDVPRDYKRKFARAVREGRLGSLTVFPRINSSNHVYNFYSEADLKIVFEKFLESSETYKSAAA